jgi:hypothetical protein
MNDRQKLLIELAAEDVKKWDEMLDKLNKDTMTGIKRVIGESVLAVHRIATRDCPVKTGTLRSSYTMELLETEGSVYTDIDYAPSVEYGTDKQRAQPHLEPAHEQVDPRFKAAMEKLI